MSSTSQVIPRGVVMATLALTLIISALQPYLEEGWVDALRWAVVITCLVYAKADYGEWKQNELKALKFRAQILAISAVVFNPIKPLQFDDETWNAGYLMLAAILLVSEIGVTWRIKSLQQNKKSAISNEPGLAMSGSKLYGYPGALDNLKWLPVLSLDSDTPTLAIIKDHFLNDGQQAVAATALEMALLGLGYVQVQIHYANRIAVSNVGKPTGDIEVKYWLVASKEGCPTLQLHYVVIHDSQSPIVWTADQIYDATMRHKAGNDLNLTVVKIIPVGENGAGQYHAEYLEPIRLSQLVEL